MTDSASMTMLKKAGAKAQAVSEELAAPAKADVPVPANGNVSIEVDDMTSEQLDQLCKTEGVETPAEWPTWDAAGKRAWLKAQFGDDKESPGPTAETLVGEGVQTGEAVQAKAKKTKSAKKGAAKTEVVNSDVKTGEIVEGDVLADLVHEVENLKEKAAYDLIANLIEETDVVFFKLGGVLSVCLSNQWSQGYPSFKEMLEGKYGFGYRKAMYLIEVYNKLANSGIEWDKLKPLGWTKVQIIAPVLTVENADSWIKIAGEQNSLTLIETVKNSKKPLIEGESQPKTVTNMKFVLHSDQKKTVDAALDKAKAASSTDVASVALEYICLDYMGGVSYDQRVATAGPVATGKAIAKAFGGNPEQLAALMGQLDIEAALNAVGAAAPNLNITVALADDGESEAA